MVILLLVTTFVIAFIVAAIVARIFATPINRILDRVIGDELSHAWARYMRFAIFVVGIGGGVRVFALEKYMTAQEPYREIIPLTLDRWVFEIYETIIGTLSSTAMVLLVFFVFALIAVVIVRVFELRKTKSEQ